MTQSFPEQCLQQKIVWWYPVYFCDLKVVTEGLEDAKGLRENGMVWGEVQPGTFSSTGM